MRRVNECINSDCGHWCFCYLSSDLPWEGDLKLFKPMIPENLIRSGKSCQSILTGTLPTLP